MTGFSLCFYPKLFRLSILNSIHFWSTKSGIVLDLELAEKNAIKEFGVSTDRNVQEDSSRPPKKLKIYKPTELAIWFTQNLKKIVWNSGSLDYSKLQNVFIKDVNDKNSARGTEKKQDLEYFKG